MTDTPEPHGRLVQKSTWPPDPDGRRLEFVVIEEDGVRFRWAFRIHTDDGVVSSGYHTIHALHGLIGVGRFGRLGDAFTIRPADDVVVRFGERWEAEVTVTQEDGTTATVHIDRPGLARTAQDFVWSAEERILRRAERAPDDE